MITVVVGTSIARPTLSIKLSAVSDDKEENRKPKTNVAIKTQGFQVGFGGAKRATNEFFNRLGDELTKSSGR